jgi:protoheme IX farnesyltransferase
VTATQHTIAALNPSLPPIRRSIRRSVSDVVADYWALTKPEVNFLILITTFAGFYLATPAGPGRFKTVLILHTVFGTSLVASGAAALNQYIERFFDAQMRRTSRRPVASGRLEPNHALWFGITLSVLGDLYLALAVNLLVSFLAALTLFTYLFIYTPLKRKTSLCTLAGAFPGAVPPLIGWAAARGKLDSEAWVLYALVFLWQFPHFMAIAWMYREDYARAGYRVLPCRGEKESLIAWQTWVPSLAIIPVILFPTISGQAGARYFAAASILSSGFLYYAASLAFRRSNLAARRLLIASILYLPSAFFLMMLEKF